MTLLSQDLLSDDLLSGDLERSARSCASQDLARTGLTTSQYMAFRSTTLKSAGLCILTLLLSGGALAAVIALRTAVYVSRLGVGAG